jgi:restriction modification system DNA specificity domain protein
MSTGSTTPFVPLKFIAEIVSGGTPKADSNNWDGDIPFITPPDLNGLDGDVVRQWERTLTDTGTSGSSITKDAVLLSCRAPIGHVGVVTSEMAFNQGCKSIVPQDAEDLAYVAYCLVASRRALQALGRGTTFMEISTTQLSNFSIPWPVCMDRRAITRYLDRETSEIDAMLAALDELTRNLKQRSGIVVANELKSHYLHGTIPLAFSSGADNFFDGDWVESKDQDPDGDIRLLQLADIGDGTFLDKSNRRINQEAFERLRCREVQEGDILIARMPHPLGRACILPTGLGRTITVVDVAVLRPDPNRVIPKYLVYVLNSISFRAQLDSLQSGSTRQRISRSRLGQQRIPMPPVALQRAAVSHLDEVTGRINAMLAKIDELKALLVERRAALITDVVTGRKKVPA